MSISLLVNGEPLAVPANLSLAELIDQCGLDVDTEGPFAVAVNGEHVPMSNLPTRHAEDGDRVEVLTVRQGG